MSDHADHSISIWLSGLKHGEEEAARQVFEQCFERLVNVAKGRLAGIPRRMADEEDVALSVFNSLCRGAAAGRFERLSGRNDLWQILMAITQQKVVDLKRHNLRQKRGGGEVRGDSIFLDNDGGQSGGGIENFAIEDVTPLLLCTLEEEHERMLGLLRDDSLRRIALLRMEGYQDREIATELEISLRTVERKLQLIRDTWTKEIMQ